MNSVSELPLIVLAILVLGGGAWWMMSRTESSSLSELDPGIDLNAALTEDARPVPKELKARMPAPQPRVSVDSTSGYVRLPDGTFIPNLNGVKSHAKLAWGAGPFSPIDYKMVDADGIEWYVLKNGDQLTTVRWPGTENGKPVMRDIIVRHQFKEPLPAASAEQLEALKQKK